MEQVWFLEEFGGSAYLTASTETGLSGELIYELKNSFIDETNVNRMLCYSSQKHSGQHPTIR